MRTESFKLIAAGFVLLALPLTGCQLQVMQRSTACCSSTPCTTACGTAGQNHCQAAPCQGAGGAGFACYDVDPWCGYQPCQWRQRALAKTCPKGTIRYIPRDTNPAVFGGRGTPGGVEPQTVAYYVPPAHLQKQVETPAPRVFQSAPQSRFGHAPAPAMNQPPHRAQAIEAAEETATPEVTTEPDEAATPQNDFVPANDLPPVKVDPSAAEATNTADPNASPAPVIRPLEDPSDPTAPRNLIPGLSN